MATPAFLRRLDAESRVRLAPSPIAGVGVFALQPLEPGTDPFPGAVADVATRFVPDAELTRLSDATRTMVEDFCLPRVEDGVPGRWVYTRGFNRMDPSYYLNHADAPRANVAMCDDPASTLCVFRTLRRVAAGEELLFNYNAPPGRVTS